MGQNVIIDSSINHFLVTRLKTCDIDISILGPPNFLRCTLNSFFQYPRSCGFEINHGSWLHFVLDCAWTRYTREPRPLLSLFEDGQRVVGIPFCRRHSILPSLGPSPSPLLNNSWNRPRARAGRPSTRGLIVLVRRRRPRKTINSNQRTAVNRTRRERERAAPGAWKYSAAATAGL